jgi:hypothetical protein
LTRLDEVREKARAFDPDHKYEKIVDKEYCPLIRDELLKEKENFLVFYHLPFLQNIMRQSWREPIKEISVLILCYIESKSTHLALHMPHSWDIFPSMPTNKHRSRSHRKTKEMKGLKQE